MQKLNGSKTVEIKNVLIYLLNNNHIYLDKNITYWVFEINDRWGEIDFKNNTLFINGIRNPLSYLVGYFNGLKTYKNQ